MLGPMIVWRVDVSALRDWEEGEDVKVIPVQEDAFSKEGYAFTFKQPLIRNFNTLILMRDQRWVQVLQDLPSDISGIIKHEVLSVTISSR